MTTALVIGGTGQSGPYVVEGLLRRGYKVTVLHGGFHEVAFSRDVEHIHTDAHFAEPLGEALDDRSFDLIVCTYGRTRVVAEVMKGRTARFIAITGLPVYAWADPLRSEWGPAGLTAAAEDSPKEVPPGRSKLGEMVWKTEQALMDAHAAGHYSVTLLRYPAIYGPRAVNGRDWSVVRRALDKRRRLIVAHGGLRLRTMAYVENAASAVMLAIDQPAVSAGAAYNVGDDGAFLTQGQRIAMLARALDHEFELVSLPDAVVEALFPGEWGFHRVVDTTKIRSELGYRDVVEPSEAIDRTAHWWSENRASKEQEAKWADKFDYILEDKLLDAFQSQVSDFVTAASLPDSRRAHSFRHPQRVGENWSKAASERLSAGPAAPFPYSLWS